MSGKGASRQAVVDPLRSLKSLFDNKSHLANAGRQPDAPIEQSFWHIAQNITHKNNFSCVLTALRYSCYSRMVEQGFEGGLE